MAAWDDPGREPLWRVMLAAVLMIGGTFGGVVLLWYLTGLVIA